MPSYFSVRDRFKKPEIKEDSIYLIVARHLKICYPDVLYRFDYGAGIPLGWKAAKQQKLLQKGRAFPDLLIYEPVDCGEGSGFYPVGLALEIKRGGERIFKKDGSFVTEHVKEQDELLKKLESVGWKVMFTIGLEETIETIDKYLIQTNAKKKATIRY